MRIIDNWKAVLRHAYSVHFAGVGVFCLLLGTVGTYWPYFDGFIPLPPPLFGLLGIFFSVAGVVGRFIPQSKISGGTDADQ